MTVKEVEIYIERLKYSLKVAIQIIEDLVDDNLCGYDHDGNCQAHGQVCEFRCPHARAKEFLKAMEV